MFVRKKKLIRCLPLILLACGCNPISTAVKIGFHVVGDVVDDARTDKVGQDLMGRNVAQADAALGQPIEVYSDVNSSRQWRSYPVPMDVLNNQRYVVEAVDNRIVLVEMVKMDSGKVDIALALIYHEKLKGKPAAECEAELKMGAPIMSLRAQSSGQLVQLYDARLIKELPKPHYCIVRYDTSGSCEKVKFAEVAATAGQS
jgi:hypothetical protein